MAERGPKDRDQKIKEIGELIGEAVLLTISNDRPESGQDELTEEDKAKVKEQVGEAFELFLKHRDWKLRTDPVVEEFKKFYMKKVLKDVTAELRDHEDKTPHLQRVIQAVFPSLDPEFEEHALMNLIAKLTTVGPFRKIKDETVAKIIEETMTYLGLSIAYLHWRVQSTTPPVGEQH